MPGLDPFYATFNNPKNTVIACVGDSTTFGTNTTNLLGWPGALRTLMTPRWGNGGDGLHTRDRNTTMTTGSDAWTLATTSNTWDCAPCLSAFTFSNAGTWLGNTATKIATWTKPSFLTVNAFYIWAVDGTSAGNFSYSTDGGTTWLNVSATWTGSNTLKRILVPTQITGTNTIKIRGANATGTAVNCYLAGIEPITNSTAPILHNLGAPGEDTASFVRTTSGNWHAFFDLLQPPLVFYMITNDESFWEAFGGDLRPAFQAKMETLATMVTGYGGCMVFMNFFEQAGRDVTMQAEMRVLVKTVAAEYGMPVIDFYDLVGNNAATVAAGYMLAGDVHPTDAGATFMAQQIWKLIAKSGVGATNQSRKKALGSPPH